MVVKSVEDSASYPLAEFRRLTGLGDTAIRQAESEGLQVAWVGNQKWISGKEWNRFLRERSGIPRGTKGGGKDAGVDSAE
jgi:hypothetical protein